MNNEAFSTVDEASRLVGRSHWTIRLWLRKGLLTRYVTRGRILIRRAELLALVKPKRAGISQNAYDHDREGK